MVQKIHPVFLFYVFGIILNNGLKDVFLILYQENIYGNLIHNY